MRYLAAVHGGMVQNSCLTTKLLGHNRSLNWLKRVTLEFKSTFKTCMVSVMRQTEPHQEWRLDFNRFSNWKRLLRVIGSVKRFIQNNRSVKEQRDVGQLSPAEMEDPEVYTIKSSQKEYFKQEYDALQRGGHVSTSSKLASLSPELDIDVLIRCNGRLKSLPYDARFPVILPRDSCLTRLIVRPYHEENNHSAGTNHLLSVLSRRFWEIAGREVIKECTNHCMICKKNKALLPHIS